MMVSFFWLPGRSLTSTSTAMRGPSQRRACCGLRCSRAKEPAAALLSAAAGAHVADTPAAAHERTQGGARARPHIVRRPRSTGSDSARGAVGTQVGELHGATYRAGAGPPRGPGRTLTPRRQARGHRAPQNAAHRTRAHPLAPRRRSHAAGSAFRAAHMSSQARTRHARQLPSTSRPAARTHKPARTGTRHPRPRTTRCRPAHTRAAHHA